MEFMKIEDLMPGDKFMIINDDYDYIWIPEVKGIIWTVERCEVYSNYCRIFVLNKLYLSKFKYIHVNKGATNNIKLIELSEG